MKKLILLFLFPFITKAQQPTEDKIKHVPAEEIVSVPTPSKDAKEIIEGYRQRVINGESMSAMAVQYSEDPGSAKKGGLYLNLKRGVFVPEFEAVAFSLQPGEISEVFQTKYGFHFIQLVAQHGETIDLRHILVTQK